ncbi:MAG: hypothetical protein IT537_07100 [Hyphomicrobiales bacterium]|nr:hypothetical protein [Hyphomicrobiales bacterium]
MRRSTLLGGAILLALAATLFASAPTEAGWQIVRWADGDCKVWGDDNVGAKPWGSGWAQLTKKPAPTWAAGYATLGTFHKKKPPKCR